MLLSEYLRALDKSLKGSVLKDSTLTTYLLDKNAQLKDSPEVFLKRAGSWEGTHYLLKACKDF